MGNIETEPKLTVDAKLMEEIKKLRANITFLDAKVINITSVMGREGKSTVSFWLAESLSEISKKVILIDANIRKNNDNNDYTVENDDRKGLSEYLQDKISLEKIICKFNESLDLVLSGEVAKNPAELLSNFKLKDFINFCRNKYEYIIIDTPAIGEVIDAAIIAEHTDGSLLVLEPDMVDYELAKKAKEQLENSGTKLLGVVINKA